MNQLIIMRRDSPKEVSEVITIALTELKSRSRLLWVSDGVSLEQFKDLTSPDITSDLSHITGIETALLLTHLAAQEFIDCIIISGASPQVGVYLARLRWVFARLNTRCIVLVDGPLASMT